MKRFTIFGKLLTRAEIEAVKAKHEALSAASQKLGAALYAQQPEPGEPSGSTADDASAGSSGQSGSDDDVVDAEIVDEGK